MIKPPKSHYIRNTSLVHNHINLHPASLATMNTTIKSAQVSAT